MLLTGSVIVAVSILVGAGMICWRVERGVEILERICGEGDADFEDGFHNERRTGLLGMTWSVLQARYALERIDDHLKKQATS